MTGSDVVCNSSAGFLVSPAGNSNAELQTAKISGLFCFLMPWREIALRIQHQNSGNASGLGCFGPRFLVTGRAEMIVLLSPKTPRQEAVLVRCPPRTNPLPTGNQRRPVYRPACRVMWLLRAPCSCQFRPEFDWFLFPQVAKTSEAAVKSSQFPLEGDPAKGQRQRW